jgi:hypothetical protein
MALFSVALAVSGCAHQIVVKCDGKLVPINAPAPKAANSKPSPHAISSDNQ